MDSPQSDSEKMLRRYIYEYMVRKNLPISAQIFQEEAQLPIAPGDIDDSSSSFLPDWWSIFSDAFFASRSDRGSQSIANEAPFFMSSHQPCANDLEPVSSVKEGHIETQSLQPSMTLPAGAVNLGGNNLRGEFLITQSQPINPEHQFRYVGLDEDWIKHSNFFNDMEKNVESICTKGKNTFIPTAHLQDSHVQYVAIQSSSQTEFGNARVTGPHPVDSKGKAPISGLPDTGTLRKPDAGKFCPQLTDNLSTVDERGFPEEGAKFHSTKEYACDKNDGDKF